MTDQPMSERVTEDIAALLREAVQRLGWLDGTNVEFRERCNRALAARPASAEPVAWAIREADGKWTSGNTYRTEERASRMVRALTSEGAHGLRVFPLYTTPPAAAP